MVSGIPDHGPHSDEHQDEPASSYDAVPGHTFLFLRQPLMFNTLLKGLVPR